MDWTEVFAWSLRLTSICAITISLWLWWHGKFRPALTALAGFCFMLAVWSGGHLALLDGATLLGSALILANPLMPAFYLQFALDFVVDRHSEAWLQRLKASSPWLFFVSVFVVLCSWSLPSADIHQTSLLPAWFIFTDFGWFNLLYTVSLGILAHWVLWRGWLQHQGNKRRSIAAIACTASLGFVMASSFVLPSFGVQAFPYPMVLLPGYLLLFTYSVVRYQILAVNAFASRALLMLLMSLLLLFMMAMISVLFGQLGMPALAAVPDWQLWLYSSLLLLLAAASYQPVSRWVERLIYPGVQLTEHMVSQWLQQLSRANSWTLLCEQALQLLQQPLQQPICIQLKVPNQATVIAGAVTAPIQLCCEYQQQQWHWRLQGQDELTPTMRLTAEVFGSLLQSSCVNLQRSLALAEAETARINQQHLVELGALAAAMAHELRNPLNIISMASAAVDQELRGHIQQQLRRADRLIADLLVYAGKITLQRQSCVLNQQLETVMAQFDWQQVQCDIQVDPQLCCDADPHRLHQVMTNLFDNALAFLRNQPDAQLQICAQAATKQHRTGVILWVHNNGPAVAPDVQAQLFQPFVSHRVGGHGLGLAIVQRIISAHQGEICFRDDVGWPVTFEIWLPDSWTDGVVKHD